MDDGSWTHFSIRTCPGPVGGPGRTCWLGAHTHILSFSICQQNKKEICIRRHTSFWNIFNVVGFNSVHCLKYFGSGWWEKALLSSRDLDSISLWKTWADGTAAKIRRHYRTALLPPTWSIRSGGLRSSSMFIWWGFSRLNIFSNLTI